MSAVLMRGDDGRLWWYCPACGCHHGVAVVGTRMEGEHPRWQWNGDYEAPTFYPAVRCTTPANEDQAEVQCLCWVEDGTLRYEPESTHALAGLKNVPMQSLLETLDLRDIPSSRTP